MTFCNKSIRFRPFSLVMIMNVMLVNVLFRRGVSSTVRRCIEKETGREYAAKIIDLSNDSVDGSSSYDATKQEINILRHVAGHPYISKYEVNMLGYG